MSHENNPPSNNESNCNESYSKFDEVATRMISNIDLLMDYVQVDIDYEKKRIKYDGEENLNL
jgi:hypothetical protein